MRTYLLQETLTDIFNKVQAEGGFPDAWAMGVVTPVPKPKGNPLCMDDHRPIVVGPALGKLFSIVLMRRLDTWAEDAQLRATTQFGFRQSQGTDEGSFLLKHVIDSYRTLQKPVYAAFVDLRKAYDSIDRELLWKVLRSLGVQDWYLDTLRAMYSDVRLRVRLGGQQGDTFPSTRGVKQGDPLSPLLFGLFIDRLESFLEARAPTLGVNITGRLLRAILYADDIVLLADSAQELQALLDVLEEFCRAAGMRPNPKKCEVVVYNDASWPAQVGRASVQWTLNDIPLKKSLHYCYLGTFFEGGKAWDQGRMTKAWTEQQTKGRGAMFAFISNCRTHHLYTPYIISHLYNSQALSVMGFGCEIWGPGAFLDATIGKYTICDNKFEDVHNLFMRRTLCVGRSTSIAAMRHALNRTPVFAVWIPRILNFWNRLLRRGGNNFLAQSLHSQLQEPGSWGNQVLHLLKEVPGGYTLPIDTHGRPTKIEQATIKAIVESLVERESEKDRVLVQNLIIRANEAHTRGSLVRACPDDARLGFTRFKWQQWLMGPRPDHKAPAQHKHTFAANAHSFFHVRTLSNFMCANSWLNCSTGRTSHDGTAVPRSARICTLCPRFQRMTQDPEDEMHIFVCPLYEPLKGSYPRVFSSRAYRQFYSAHESKLSEVDELFRTFLTQGGPEFWSQLAEFLIACRNARLTFQDDFRTNRGDLDDFSDTDDEAV